MVKKQQEALNIRKEQQRLVSLELAYFALVKALHDKHGLDIKKLIETTKKLNLGGVELKDNNLILQGLNEIKDK